jgi:hypothetical protein
VFCAKQRAVISKGSNGITHEHHGHSNTATDTTPSVSGIASVDSSFECLFYRIVKQEIT